MGVSELRRVEQALAAARRDLAELQGNHNDNVSLSKDAMTVREPPGAVSFK